MMTVDARTLAVYRKVSKKSDYAVSYTHLYFTVLRQLYDPVALNIAISFRFFIVCFTEYLTFNDGQRQGDFEQVISLIDAYNTLQSDRVNDKEQFVDSLMYIKGQILGNRR